MALLKKKEEKKPFVVRSSGGAGGEVSPLRPQAVPKLAPCIAACPSGNDVRAWLTVIAQREKTGLSLEQACDRAWQIEVETNPFPAVMGRVCPHPCEGECNRKDKDGAVGINSVERFLGDWALERGLKLPTLPNGGPHEERIAVVGSGPSGLSCAYQLARRGYKVTVFEAFEKPGGMLRYGIPRYRLPREVLDAEIRRILDVGVELRCGTTIGKDLTLEDLKRDYAAVFVGIGAHKGKTMGLPGEDGPGVYTGTDFLNRVNSGKGPDVGARVVVVGGGDTAIDAARVSLRLGSDAAGVSRRLGAEVTILYRRTRAEMPAIAREIDEALEEGIRIEFLAAPARIGRDASGRIDKLSVQRMQLGEPDASGRRRPVPIEGDVYEMDADTVVMAVSQQPDWSTLGAVAAEGSWLDVDDWGRTAVERVWSGGDTLRLGLATISIGQGRKAAESIDATLQGRKLEASAPRTPIRSDKIKLDYYEARTRAERRILGPEERLARPMDEVDGGLDRAQAIEETARCFSCGLCFGCERCWMYCQSNCFKKLPDPRAGAYYKIDLSVCDGCRKCAEECPCGFLDLI
jgi:NADPH-dependent glutamate synthase beta subunit-like oxidoreductase/Pyruvate/2-oxoacid:ferredoxin oxidoreductase delta subunit